MANTGNLETDKLDLIEIETVKGLLGRTISCKDGSSQEVFHNGEHSGSVLQANAAITGDSTKQRSSMLVHNGDIIVHVNLGVQPLVWSDVLFTSDGYTQKYQAELRIHVIEPVCFARRCLQHSDPVKLAQTAIHDALLSYARRYEHDQISITSLRYLAENTLLVGVGWRTDDNRVTGLKVVSTVINHFIDPRRAKVIEETKQAQIKAEELIIQKRLMQQQAEELDIQAQQRELELRTQTFIKTREIQHTAALQKTEAQEKDAVQELQDKLEQGRQERSAEFERQKEARRKEFERQEEAKYKEYERQEQVLEEGAELNAQLRGVRGQMQLLTDQQQLEKLRREHTWKVEDETKQRTRIEMEQEQIFAIESDERKLLGQGRLESQQRQQISERKEHERYEETLQYDHKRNEEWNQFSLDLQKKAKILSHEQKSVFLRQIVNALGEQISLEISDGGALADIGNIMRIIDDFQPTSNALPESQRTKITQESSMHPHSQRQAYLLEGRAYKQEPPLLEKPEEEGDGQFSECDLQREETIYIPRMGLSLIQANLSQKQCARVGLDMTTVFIIWKLHKGSSAARAHIQVGDMLLAINQTMLRSLQVLSEALQNCANETTVTLGILRGIKRWDWQVELEQ